MNLEKIEKLAEDALTSGHYEAAACLYLGLYEIAKLKSTDLQNAKRCQTCPSVGSSPVTITYQNARGTYEKEI